jgi:hypothetical protein
VAEVAHACEVNLTFCIGGGHTQTDTVWKPGDQSKRWKQTILPS